MKFSSLLSSSIAVCLAVACGSGGVAATPIKRAQNCPSGYLCASFPELPGYGIRYLSSNTCDPSVVQYSGYIDVENGNAHYFFWFFESRNNPAVAPLTVWINGGPGCSSMIGLFQELGPCTVNSAGTATAINPNSWNTVSNMLFIDQPVGTGFSYGNDAVHSTMDAAPLIYSSLQVFLRTFPKYGNAPFHFFGESYGGHYVPAFAKYIFDSNHAVLAKQSSNLYINLKSIGIGNGWVNPLIQFGYYEQMACNSSYGSVLPASDCQAMTNAYPQCASLEQTCYTTGNDSDCLAADTYCNRYTYGPIVDSGRDVYDIRAPAADPFPSESYVSYLQTPSVQQALGAQTKFQECPNGPYNKFKNSGDDARSFHTHVAALLDNGVRVLVYSGDADYICNWYGGQAWVLALNWSGHSSFNAAPFPEWSASRKSGAAAGQVRTYQNFQFVRVYAAGHEVPAYQPVNSLYMFTHWLAGQAL